MTELRLNINDINSINGINGINSINSINGINDETNDIHITIDDGETEYTIPRNNIITVMNTKWYLCVLLELAALFVLFGMTVIDTPYFIVYLFNAVVLLAYFMWIYVKGEIISIIWKKED